jgi:hypothetical protein
MNQRHGAQFQRSTLIGPCYGFELSKSERDQIATHCERNIFGGAIPQSFLTTSPSRVSCYA